MSVNREVDVILSLKAFRQLAKGIQIAEQITGRALGDDSGLSFNAYEDGSIVTGIGNHTSLDWDEPSGEWLYGDGTVFPADEFPFGG